jgi:methionyl aminopeptidase
MIYIKSEEEIGLLRESGLLVSRCLGEVAKHVKPGINTSFLDKIAEEFLRDHGGIPGFLGYNGYPKTLCTSVNAQVVHGIPSETILVEGDIVSVDCGVILNGYFGDSAYTFAVGEVKPVVQKLMRVTKECLYKGIEQAVEGKRMGDLGYAIQNHAELNGFSVVREMVGHGLGKDLHEEPEVPNYGRRGSGVKLLSNMVICIEPMINQGKKTVVQDKDGWTIKTMDKLPSAHYEHALVIRKDKAEILSTFEFIENELNKK